MIYKFDHIGITVSSLKEAQEQINAVYPCFHAQQGIQMREALKEVSIHRPERFSISLHRMSKDINVELIEYPQVSPRTGSILPWRYDAQESFDNLQYLKTAIREQLNCSLADYRFTDIAAQIVRHAEFNAVVIPVENLATEEHFWKGLRFKTMYCDPEIMILSLKSLIPPAQDNYIIFYKVDFGMQYHTDMEGINEIALLCHSCSGDLKAFPQDVFKSTSVGRFFVDGKELDLGYLRSPSGVLVELLSVNLRQTKQCSKKII